MLTERQFHILQAFTNTNPVFIKGDTWCYDRSTKQIFSPLSEGRLQMLSVDLPRYKTYKKINPVRTKANLLPTPTILS